MFVFTKLTSSSLTIDSIRQIGQAQTLGLTPEAHESLVTVCVRKMIKGLHIVVNLIFILQKFIELNDLNLANI